MRSDDRLSIKQHFFVFKRVARSYRAKKVVEISYFTVGKLAGEGDLALTQKLTTQEDEKNMHPFALVMNARAQDCLVVYSID